MRVKLITFILLTLITTSLFGITRRVENSDTIIVLNMENLSVFPRNFRMSTDTLDETPLPPSTLGLDKLHISGSGQFSQLSLELMLKVIPAQSMTIVDLREESHGYLNGNAMSWYGDMNLANLGKSVQEIRFDEQLKLQQSLDNGFIYYLRDSTLNLNLMDVDTAYDEASLAQYYHVQYARLPCTDHRRPTDSVVDDFVAFMRSRPNGTWLHFHCSAGKGRTTTFMTMVDIFLNAKEVSLDDIIERQILIGGKDIWQLPSTDSWKYDTMVDRIDFLKEFYTFCRTEKNQSWTQWLLEKN